VVRGGENNELIKAYTSLINRYNETKKDPVDYQRRNLLSYLYKLELRIYETQSSRQTDYVKVQEQNNRRKEIIEPLLEEIETLSDAIKQYIQPNDNEIYKQTTKYYDYDDDYYLYRKEDGLYYNKYRSNRKQGEPKNITTLFDVSNQGSLDIELTLNVLREFIIQKIKELEVNICGYMNMEYIMNYIKKQKYVDDELPENMMVIYVEYNLEEIETSFGFKTLYYYLYYNKITKKLSYKIHGNPYTQITPLYHSDMSQFSVIDTLYTLKVLHDFIKILPTISPNKTMFGRIKDMFSSNRVGQAPSVGGNPIATAPSYKLNGEKVHLLINKKKLHRSVYVKDKGNGKAKYCKINNEFVLLSKLKNKVI